MTDLVNDLLDALEGYDTTMASWKTLRTMLGRDRAGYRVAVDTADLDRALYAYASEQIMQLRLVNGSVEADAYIEDMPGEPLKAVLVMAGRLQAAALVDNLIVYAAHMAALTPYARRSWANVVEVVVMASLQAGEMRVA